jgi:hypothetical protein
MGSSKQATRTASVKKAPALRMEEVEDDKAAQRTEQIEDDTAAQGTDGQEPRAVQAVIDLWNLLTNAS